MEVDSDESGGKGFDELPTLSWNYRMRREKQEILPNIYLGPYQAAAKPQLQALLQDEITHILCVRQSVEAKCVKLNFPEHFKYEVIEFRDHPFESVIQHFPRARDFIDECLGGGGKILVHGVNGISRSATLVIAYIMEKHDMSYEDAFAAVRRRRYCVDPNYGFRSQLKEYEPIYRARSMKNSWPENNPSKSSRKRRPSEEDDDFDMDLNENVKKSAFGDICSNTMHCGSQLPANGSDLKS